MSAEYFDDDWCDDLDFEEIVADAAGEIGEAAQQSITQPGGLYQSLYNVVYSSNLYRLSAAIRIASVEQRPRAISKTRSLVSQTLVRIDPPPC